MIKRILIVDDDKWFADALQANLADKFQIETASHAADIFPTIEKFHPDIILLDLVLPEINAITFLNEFSSYDDLTQIDIYVMSSVANMVELDSLLKFGVKAVLDKATLTTDNLEKLL